MLRRLFMLLLALAMVGFSGVPASSDTPGFKTAQPPAAVALAPGVVIDPILTAGDVVGGYQATGVFDGIGFRRTSDGRIQLFVDHELAKKDPVTRPTATDNFDARVSHLTLSSNGGVTAGEYPITGNEGFIWFCSGNLTKLDGTPWFFTGEEDQDFFSPHGGTTIAIDTRDNSYQVLDHFGLMAHEQELPVRGLDQATFVLPEDQPGAVVPNTAVFNVSQLYSYTADDWDGAIAGDGQLGVFVPDGTFADGDPSTNDIHKGQTLTGHFEALDQATDNANQASLETAAQAAGAFDFIRLEDAAASQTEEGVVYFSDTGRKGRESVRGRVYRLEFDENDPTQAKLSVVLDGDAGDNIINPDNLDTSGRTLMIQEDRNSEHRFVAGVSGSLLQPGESPYSRMLAYNLRTGAIRVIARPDTYASLIPTRGEGDWETSGITNASKLWGKGWWLFDVQMHHTTVMQPDGTLVPNTTMGEGGQLLRIFIPGT